MGNSEIVGLLLMFALACAQYTDLSYDGHQGSPPAVDGGYSDPGANYPEVKAPSRSPASTGNLNPKAPLPIAYPPFQEDPSYPYQQQEIYPLIIAVNGTDPYKETDLKSIPMQIIYQQHTQDKKADQSNPYGHNVPYPNYPYDPTVPSDDKDASDPNTFPRYKEPVYPATPSYPNDQSYASTSSYPKQPTEPSKGPYPNKPLNPSKPNDSHYPSGSSFDKGSIDPGTSEKYDPSYPATPSDPSEPNHSTAYNKQPTGPSTPSYPKNPSDPDTDSRPSNPSHPSKPSYTNNPPYPSTPSPNTAPYPTTLSPPKNPTYPETANSQDASPYLTNPEPRKDSSYHVVKSPAKLSKCLNFN